MRSEFKKVPNVLIGEIAGSPINFSRRNEPAYQAILTSNSSDRRYLLEFGNPGIGYNDQVEVSGFIKNAIIYERLPNGEVKPVECFPRMVVSKINSIKIK